MNEWMNEVALRNQYRLTVVAVEYDSRNNYKLHNIWRSTVVIIEMIKSGQVPYKFSSGTPPVAKVCSAFQWSSKEQKLKV